MRYKRSKYVQTLPLDDDTVAIGHGIAFHRMVASASVHAVLELFAEEAMSLDELVDAVELESATPRETLTAMFRTFVDKSFLVPEDADEDAQLRATIDKRLVGSTPRFQVPHLATLDSFEVPPALAGTFRHVEILCLGGCLSEAVEEPLRALAPSYGLTVGVRNGWLTDVHLLDPSPDLLILQPGVYRVLAPLTSKAFYGSETTRRNLLASVRTELDTLLAPFTRFRGHVLVQGIASFQIPPHGRADARLPLGHQEIMGEINAHLRAFVTNRPNMMFVDEERLAGTHGKATLLDDLFNVSAHHGASGARMPQLLAREYLDSYVVLSGLRRIKCIVTDLDNTLWSGVVGEGSGPSAETYPFPGIREALAMFRARGILLASCSKNNHDDVMQFWRGVENLSPDDFVLHCINWDPKPQNLARILDKLGLAPEAVLVIDDHPVERAEIAAAFPGTRVLGDNIRTLRATLLADPYLDVHVITDEARERTASTRAVLSREAARERAPDRDAFLRSLEIELEVTRVSEHFDRLAELSQRTNQFNTTLVRYDARRLAELAADPDASVWSLAVRDRFASYGIVGLCVVRGDEIENISISCRVLGLGVDQPFLATVLAHLGNRRVMGRIVLGERNQPSRRVFADAGFREVTPLELVRDAADHPPTIDASIYRVS